MTTMITQQQIKAGDRIELDGEAVTVETVEWREDDSNEWGPWLYINGREVVLHSGLIRKLN